MCSACGFPAAPGHWTEAGALTPGDRLRAKYRRDRLLRTVMPLYGLSARDVAQSTGIQLSTSAGKHTIVRNLEELWAAAEAFTGAPVDPLDPRFTGGEKA